MAFKYFRYLIDFALALLSSLLLVVSFPKFDLGLLAWIGLTPLLVAIHGKGLRYSFFLSFICGLLFFAGIFHWILVVPGYTLLHHALFVLFLPPYFAFFGLAFGFISRRWSLTPALFAAPFIWVSLEYIRSNLSFMALPWALLAHSQYQYPVIIQIASVAGAYGISFLIVMVNSAFAAIVLSAHESYQLRRKYHVKISNHAMASDERWGLRISKAGRVLVLVTASLVVFTLIYGSLVISEPLIGTELKISIVQGNIVQEKKWDPRYARKIMQTYAELTEEASKNQPALIIWPETATPRSINEDLWLRTEVRNIAKESGTYLLLGSAEYQKFQEGGSKKFKLFNSAFLIPPEPRLAKNQRYDKIRLFPFGEYLPLKEVIPWSYINVPNISEYVAGREFTIFEASGSRFGVTICWENIFPDLFRQFVKRGAQFMVNITNEAWFERTAAPYQLVSMSVFRAVENRVFVVRCANTGVSCIIDPYGRIVDRVKDEKSQDIFVRGVMCGRIIPLESRTFYTCRGDLLVWVSFLGSIGFLLIAWAHSRKARRAESHTKEL
jgi:apolipoprotein N-acyltransferase